MVSGAAMKAATIADVMRQRIAFAQAWATAGCSLTTAIGIDWMRPPGSVRLTNLSGLKSMTSQKLDQSRIRTSWNSCSRSRK